MNFVIKIFIAIIFFMLVIELLELSKRYKKEKV
jgi:hypothetical protein